MNCRFCGSDRLTQLVSHKNYPVFIGCTDAPRERDELYDFEILHCLACDGIQQMTLPPLDILYREKRAFGLGRTWAGHYDAFFEFVETRVRRDNVRSVLEIGGGNGLMLRRLHQAAPDIALADVEPFPHYDFDYVTVHRTYFDQNFTLDGAYDVIYASHLIEHLADVNPFFAKAFQVLRPGGSLITACPDIAESFKNRHLNAFTTDHFNYFTPSVLAGIAARHGFAVAGFQAYRDHGMYFEFRKSASTAPVTINHTPVRPLFDRYRRTLDAFVRHIAVQDIARAFVFGAHAFTITFLRYLGETAYTIDAVLDNEPTKQGRRLTGTNLICRSPQVLAGLDGPTVLMYMGAYTDEICDQLQALNPSVRLVRLDTFDGLPLARAS
jgi:SAM-dependent methyltransferase